MEKITYLLGAGASANALPLAKDVKNDIGEIRYKSISRRLGELVETMNDFGIEYMTNDFAILANEAIRFSTVDTYAKYLYEIRKLDELESLKKTLSTYFLLDQFYYNNKDPRYLTFLTSILQDGKLPDNINIVTWNYDYQFQIACSVFENEVKTSDSTNFVRFFPSHGETIKPSDNNFKLVHLNGIAGFHFKEDQFQNKFIGDNLNNKSLAECLDAISDGQAYKQTNLNFAYELENSIQSQRALHLAVEIIRGTSILVVIGYSFPFFNRHIDKALFRAMTQKRDANGNFHNSKMKKIYFQDPASNGKYLSGRFNVDQRIIDHIPNVEQFYIPMEL